MNLPSDDELVWRVMLDAERDDAAGDFALLGEEPTESPNDELSEVTTKATGEIAASGITSHVFTRSGIRAWSKSTFKPPHTTDAVFTRVAFYTADTGRLVLSNWLNKGSANPYQTLIQHWYFDDARARKALVLWSMNGSTWRSWAS